MPSFWLWLELLYFLTNLKDLKYLNLMPGSLSMVFTMLLKSKTSTEKEYSLKTSLKFKNITQRMTTLMKWELINSQPWLNNSLLKLILILLLIQKQVKESVLIKLEMEILIGFLKVLLLALRIKVNVDHVGLSLLPEVLKVFLNFQQVNWRVSQNKI